MSSITTYFLSFIPIVVSLNITFTGKYYELPRFWTSTGFCPVGSIKNHDVRTSLLSPETHFNIKLIGALPNEAITHIRVHWLLELISFIEFGNHGIPKYNFTDLDTFILRVNDVELYPGFEFMGNPGGIFSFHNRLRFAYLWKDLVFQVTRQYLNLLEKDDMLRWRFESWNEPDLLNYNLLNFTVDDYESYLDALRNGLDAAGRRAEENIHFPLRGPAGLFKTYAKHPLCWSILEKCNKNLSTCPIDKITFHRKGFGSPSEVLTNGRELLITIFNQFPNLKRLPVSNNEADPISGWSIPRDFQEDMRYAVAVVEIILDHWKAHLCFKEFRNFESLSHDNAFLSYHPYEFSQRTLLAHFRMNNSNPVHSQFIQKPVYAALGLLGNLGQLSMDVETLTKGIRLLKTTSTKSDALYISWLIVCTQEKKVHGRSRFNTSINFKVLENKKSSENFAFIIEVLEFGRTDPVFVWRKYGSPPYPNATVRRAMRFTQSPKLLASEIIFTNHLKVNFRLQHPWLCLLRICRSKLDLNPTAPRRVKISKINSNEVLITWKQKKLSRCLKTYEVWFRSKLVSLSPWKKVSKGYHIPFLSYQFAPENGQVQGFYKIRSIDVFNIRSKFSKCIEYGGD